MILIQCDGCPNSFDAYGGNMDISENMDSFEKTIVARPEGIEICINSLGIPERRVIVNAVIYNERTNKYIVIIKGEPTEQFDGQNTTLTHPSGDKL